MFPSNADDPTFKRDCTVLIELAFWLSARDSTRLPLVLPSSLIESAAHSSIRRTVRCAMVEEEDARFIRISIEKAQLLNMRISDACQYVRLQSDLQTLSEYSPPMTPLFLGHSYYRKLLLSVKYK